MSKNYPAAALLATLAASLPFSISPASAASGENAPEPPLPLSSPAVRTEVEAVVRKFSDMYHDMYAVKNPKPPLELFDRNDPAPQYLPEEMPDWVIGWERLDWYFNDPKRNTFMQGQDMIPSNIRVRSLTPDLALATWNIFADMKFVRGPSMGEKLRATAILRRTGEGWKFIYYAESPKSTMAYVRDMYENMARPEFREEMTTGKPGAGK